MAESNWENFTSEQHPSNFEEISKNSEQNSSLATKCFQDQGSKAQETTKSRWITASVIKHNTGSNNYDGTFYRLAYRSSGYNHVATQHHSVGTKLFQAASKKSPENRASKTGDDFSKVSPLVQSKSLDLLSDRCEQEYVKKQGVSAMYRFLELCCMMGSAYAAHAIHRWRNN